MVKELAGRKVKAQLTPDLGLGRTVCVTKPRELSQKAQDLLTALGSAAEARAIAQAHVEQITADLLRELKAWPNRHVGELLGMTGQAVHQRRQKLKRPRRKG